MVKVEGKTIHSIWAIINVATGDNSDHYAADKQTLNIGMML
jgi:hypothetical protein